jgi:hypothetical protein
MVFIEWLIGCPAFAALPFCLVRRNLWMVTTLLPPEDVEGLDFEDFAHPDIA